jgi:hypothetical protein
VTERVVLWRRLDLPGHESARLFAEGAHWHLHGTAVFAHEGRPCRLDYRVVCDLAWRTQSARVAGWAGTRRVGADLSVDAERRWRMNGADCPAVTGCVDVDLGFSPSTNLLPIRRLALAVGDAADVRAAWLPFPSLDLQPLEQRYARLAERRWRYESRGGAFTAELDVDDVGFVTRYGGLWELAASS